MSGLIFENWRQRCSSLGHIMTNLPRPVTPEELSEIKCLEKERDEGINENGRKVKWTDTKNDRLSRLYKIREGQDELPAGAITHLEDVFRNQFWGRKRLVYNKYLEKGIMVEEDALKLIGDIDGATYWKNEQQYENEWIQGCPDNVEEEIGRDTKANFDLDTFDRAEMTALYEWQLKGYSFLTGIKTWELCYCLVNTPLHRIEAERKSLWYSLGMPQEDEPRWIEALAQLERNMIFDMEAFKKEFPHADLLHGKIFEFPDGIRKLEWKYDMPPQFRVKKFTVAPSETDFEHIRRRVKMCRDWLVNKEIETLKLLNQ